MKTAIDDAAGRTVAMPCCYNYDPNRVLNWVGNTPVAFVRVTSAYQPLSVPLNIRPWATYPRPRFLMLDQGQWVLKKE